MSTTRHCQLHEEGDMWAVDPWFAIGMMTFSALTPPVWFALGWLVHKHLKADLKQGSGGDEAGAI